MANSTTNIDTISSSQAGKEIYANMFFDSASPATLFGRRGVTTAALTWGIYGGKYRKADGSIIEIDNDTVSLTPSDTNYLYETDGVVSVTTSAPSGWPSPLSGGAKALYEIVTGASTVTSYTDYRTNGIGSGNLASVAAADVAIADAGTYYTGTDVEAALQEIGAALGGMGLADGDYGDITVSSTGTAMTIDNDAVTYAKMQNVSATSRILGRKTSGAGDTEECTLSEILDFIGSAAQGDILYRDASSWARLAAGTSGYFLKTQGAGSNPMWDAAGGGGLTNFTDAVSTSSPNATIPVASLTATNAASNVDAALVPKGTGGVAAAVADNSTTGGNKRGSYAVDWQTTRNNANQVASGSYSTIAGGIQNRASGDSSFVAGRENQATATYAVALGYSCVASLDGAFAAGYDNTASGQASVALGEACTASGSRAVALGWGATASAIVSLACGTSVTADANYSQATGQWATTRGLWAARVHCAAPFSSLGDTQEVRMTLSAVTTTATPKVLTADLGAASATNQMALAANTAMVVTGRVIARAETSHDCASWVFQAAIKRNSGSTTSMVAACTPTLVAADAGAATWALSVTADATNNALKVEFTGAAATNIRIGCSVEGYEVTFG